jgi:hypothetical protein
MKDLSDALWLGHRIRCIDEGVNINSLTLKAKHRLKITRGAQTLLEVKLSSTLFEAVSSSEASEGLYLRRLQACNLVVGKKWSRNAKQAC